MSTRSIVGIVTPESPEVGIGVYVHSDGYPEGRLPVLKSLIIKHGAAEVASTILSAENGGWSYLDENYTENYLGDRGAAVPGYGLKYTDVQTGEAPPQKHSEVVGDIFIEFMYYIDVPTGDIVWYEQGSEYPHRELFSEYSKVEAAEVEVVWE